MTRRLASSVALRVRDAMCINTIHQAASPRVAPKLASDLRWERCMSGPGLNQRDAHHAIHQAAFREAEQLTALLRQATQAGDQQRALQVAAVLVEHWQTRTLRHADAEESGWYRDIVAERPALREDVIALTRDHDLLRLLMAEIQGILSARGAAAGVVERFEAMLLLNGIHSREEERRLLGSQPTATDAGEATLDAGAAPLPLAVARPALHARLVELLRERGLNPNDLLADLRTDPDGRAIAHIAFGRDYAQAMEWPLEADNPTGADDARLRAVVDACERATQADYHARMRTPG